MSQLSHEYTEDVQQQEYLNSLQNLLNNTENSSDLNNKIVNIPFTNKLMTTKMGLGIVVLLTVDKANNTIDRIALSDTEPAKGAVQMSSKKFEDIKIPLFDPENIIAKAIRSGKFQQTDDWYYLFTPELDADNARFNQAGAGAASSVVYPIKGNTVSGALIFSYYKLLTEIGSEQHNFMTYYTNLVSSKL